MMNDSFEALELDTDVLHSQKLLGSKRKFTDNFRSASPTKRSAGEKRKSVLSCDSDSMTLSLDWSNWSSSGAAPTNAQHTPSSALDHATKTANSSASSGPTADKSAACAPSSHSATNESNSAHSSTDFSKYALTFQQTTTATTSLLSKRKRCASIDELDNGEDALFAHVSRSLRQQEDSQYQSSQTALLDSILSTIPTPSASSNHNTDQRPLEPPATTTSSMSGASTEEETTTTNPLLPKRRRKSRKARKRFLKEFTGEPYHDSQVLQAIERRKTIEEMKRPIHCTEEELRIRIQSVERANAHLESMPMTRRTDRQVPMVYHPQFGRMVCATRRHCRLPMEVLLSSDPATINGPYRDLRNFVLELDLSTNELLEHQFVAYNSRACWEETLRPERAAPNGTDRCVATGCTRQHVKLLLCKRHYDRHQTISRNLILTKPWWTS